MIHYDGGLAETQLPVTFANSRNKLDGSNLGIVSEEAQPKYKAVKHLGDKMPPCTLPGTLFVQK